MSPNLFDVPVRVWVSCRGEITLETMVSDDGDRLVALTIAILTIDVTASLRIVLRNIYRTKNLRGHVLGAVDGAEPAHSTHSVPAPHSVHSTGRER